MNKKEPFYLRFWNWLRKFPSQIFLAILIPCIVYSFSYLFSDEFYYQNLNYDGVELDVDIDQFSVKKINPLFKIMDISSFSNYQGGTCYNEYYVLCSNNFECILIYNMSNNKVEHTIFTNQTDTSYHCNTCFFGPDFYSSTDKFPILYISMENEGVESTLAYRLASNGGAYSMDLIQVLKFVCDDADQLYYPNSYYDYDSGCLYYGGYTQKSYMKSDDNFLRYYCFPLPDYRLAEYDLKTSNAIETFDVASETATQGGFISQGYLFQTFSFNSDSDPLRKPKMRVLDLQEHKIVYDCQDLGQYGDYDEFENIAANENGHIYGFGVKTLRIYDFEFNGKTIFL